MSQMLTAVKRVLVGRPLKTAELGEQKLTKRKALAILSSDALSSVAYGPEQILIVLMTVGVAAIWYSIPIAIGVLILLTALIASYRQIIFSYPNGGGAYVVSKQNLGTHAGLVAGGSLLVDYILTVAVSVSAGTDAITSAFPSLHNYNVAIAIGFVVLITILNLRGVTESASVLAYPVYLFVLALFILIGAGFYRMLTGQAQPEMTATFGEPVVGISLFLLLKAFASGSSALTGVEAISNAIPNFKNSAPHNAAKTLTIMGVLLAILFSGIVVMAFQFGIVPRGEATVVSQLAEQTFGRNAMYYFVQGTTALILILAANTGYSAFPLLAVNLAKDKFIPRMFMIRGDRLGYSNGIIMLSIFSILLIVMFEGQTEHLIPLYAIGVFIPFTLAQLGMVRKWLKEKPKGWSSKLMINSIGAIISFVVCIMLFLTKFSQIWPVLVFLPIIMFIFLHIKRHYEAVGEQLSISSGEPIDKIEGNVIIIPIAGMTHVVESSVAYAKSLHPKQIIAVYVSFEKEQEEALEFKWNKLHPNIRLVVLHSPYRSIIQPLSKFIHIVQRKASETNHQVTVVIPQFVPKKGWHNMLHNQSSFLIRAHLLHHEHVILTTVPYHFKK